jgi:AraC-like DNA-binding protein
VLLIFSIPTDKVLENYNVDWNLQSFNATPSDFNATPSVVNLNADFNSIANVDQDSIQSLREHAIKEANNGNSKEAVAYLTNYIGATADMSLLNDHVFENIKDSQEYTTFKNKYEPKFTFVSILYIYVGMLGFFIFLMLNLKKGIDKTSTLLIGLFVLFHSLFILHLSIYRLNYQFYLPHTLFASTTFSFLYGPLLYFYFKRSINNYQFKRRDILHLIPSLVLLAYIFPFYTMSRIEKFNVIFNQDNLLLPGAYTIIVVKILSLSIYGYLILRIYQTHKRKVNGTKNAKFLWQRNIISLHLIYVVAYIIYAASITKILNYKPVFDFQIMVMVSVVFYVAYIAYVQPEIFKGKVKLVDPINFFKYKKSGLTPLYSTELKDKLIKLLEEDKIYKHNNVSLEWLSEQLGTTRHNTSQVINEHFNMNFFELINKFRIGEAKEMLRDDNYKNLSIIQVAYEVGFNNKVTFNKSFKKYLEQTPSQYIKSIRA